MCTQQIGARDRCRHEGVTHCCALARGPGGGPGQRWALSGQQVQRPPRTRSQTRALSPSGGAARRCSALPACALPASSPCRQEGLFVRGLRLYQSQPPRSVSERPALRSLGQPTGSEKTAGGVFLMNWGFQRGDGKQAGRGGSAALCVPSRQGLAHRKQPPPHPETSQSQMGTVQGQDKGSEG